MRPGPGLGNVIAVGARVNVVRGSQVLALDVPVRNVRESWTESRDVPTQVGFTAPIECVPTHPLSPLNNFGQRIQLVCLVETSLGVEEIEIGWFQIESWEEKENGVEVICLDLRQILAASPADWPSSPPAGATLRSEMQRLAHLGEGFSLPIVLDVEDRPIPRIFQWGTNRLENIDQLSESCGLVNGVKPDGCLHAWKLPGSHPVARYTATDFLLAAPRASTGRLPNRVTVVGGSEDDAAHRFSATVKNTVFPYDAAYGLVSERTALGPAVTADQAQQAAQGRLSARLRAPETRSLEIKTDPRLEGFDVISVLTDCGEPLVGRVVAYERVLDDPAQNMRVDVEVLSW